MILGHGVMKHAANCTVHTINYYCCHLTVKYGWFFEVLCEGDDS